MLNYCIELQGSVIDFDMVGFGNHNGFAFNGNPVAWIGVILICVSKILF